MSGYYYSANKNRNRKNDSNKQYIVLGGILAVIILIAYIFSGGGGEEGDKTVDSWTARKNRSANRSKKLKADTLAKKRKVSNTSGNSGKKETYDIPSLVKKVKPSIAVITTFNRASNKVATGTGFFIDSDGTLVSNLHVFRGAHRAEIKNLSRTFDVQEVEEASSKYDLIRLTVSKSKRTVHPLVINYNLPKVGERVVVVGNPLGLDYSVSDGIVSAIREVPPYGRVIQFSSPISSGSSGSPVLNLQGEVIGVATFGAIEGQNLNFAIPIARLKGLNKTDSPELASINFEESDAFLDAETPFDKGRVLFDEGKFQAAIPHFKKAAEENPDDAQAHYYLGVCYREAKATNAAASLKRAISLDSNYIDAYIQLGMFYIQMNQSAEAIKILEEGNMVEPNNDRILMNLGIAYSLNGKHEIAISMLNKSLDIYATSKAYMYLGLSYLRFGKPREALHPLKMAMEMEPDSIPAHLGLAGAYIANRSFKQGIRMLNKIVIKAPDNAELHYLLGVLHLGNDDISSAKYELDVLRNLKGQSARSYRYKLDSAINTYRHYKRLEYLMYKINLRKRR